MLKVDSAIDFMEEFSCACDLLIFDCSKLKSRHCAFCFSYKIDVFHGAFCYAVLQQMSIAEALEFSNAMAALNCTSFGARGGIATLYETRSLTQSGGPRREDPDILSRIGTR